MNRRKTDLIQIEVDILRAAEVLRRHGIREFHGYLLAKTVRADEPRTLIGHGTLYRALLRLEERGYLTSRWEEATTQERGPRRRLYEITQEGQRGLAAVPRQIRVHRPTLRAVPS